MSGVRIFKKLWGLLSPREKRRLYLIFGAIIIMGGWELVGISSIVPFLSVASNPDMIQTNPYLRWGYEQFGLTSTRDFLLVLGVLTIVVLAVSQLFAALTNYLIQHFTNMCQYTFSVRIFAKYLRQPYMYFLAHNSASLNKTILSEVQQMVRGVLIPVTEIIARMTIALCIISFLCVLDPLLAIFVTTTLGGAYALIFWLVRHKLGRIGAKRLKANDLRFQIPAEAFGGIKDVKILGKEYLFIQKFRGPAFKYSNYTMQGSLIGSLPSYAINVIAFSGIVLITLYLIAAKETFQQALPLISIYAFGGYRLLPAIRDLYTHMTAVRFSLPTVNLLYEDLRDAPRDIDAISAPPAIDRLAIQHTLELRQIAFTYPDIPEPIFQDFNLAIRAHTSIGLVGATGCGKTTLVDMILGLLQPQQGQIIVDGAAITPDNLRNWQQNLGYVPQQIFLSDDTITRNIAFGIPDDQIDPAAIERAARIANLHEFVLQELPQRYETVVGERGIRLSGGQRQRIGIARALYHDPAVLIFDEATSALDNLTEMAVMEALNTLAGQKTMILIAHRLTTVKACDVIYLMEKGKIIAQGDYETLLQTSQKFQKMATVTK